MSLKIAACGDGAVLLMFVKGTSILRCNKALSTAGSLNRVSSPPVRIPSIALPASLLSDVITLLGYSFRKSLSSKIISDCDKRAGLCVLISRALWVIPFMQNTFYVPIACVNILDKILNTQSLNHIRLLSL